MNDYAFGNYLYEKRKQAGLTQRQAAAMLGVSDKAVSKWENGRAKPTTDVLRKLAVLYRKQLLLYREALRRSMEQEVGECLICSLALNDVISVE